MKTHTRSVLIAALFASLQTMTLHAQNPPAHNAYPHWSPDGKQIVFHSSRDGNYEIYVMNKDGSSQTRLTSNLAIDRQPRWAPDGKRIVFQSDRDSISFHGQMISELYLMNGDGSEQTALTNNRNPKITPDFSPDGDAIVLISGVREEGEIQLLDLETGEVSSIQLSADDSELLKGNAGNPHFSADGQHVLVDAQVGGEKHDLVSVALDGSGITDITQDSIQTFYPSPSPDGRFIAFGASISETDQEQWDIFVMDVDGGNIRQLTTHPAYEGWPEWSPDGKQLVFSRLIDGNLEIFVLDLEDGKEMQLTGLKQ